MAASSLYPRNPTFQCLSVQRRREILRVLTTWRTPLSEQKLTAYLGASKQGSQPVNAPVTDALRVELKHRHLPALEAAGFITWNQQEEAVETTAHPAFGDPRFERLLDIQTEDLDVVFSSLAHDYRRIVLTVLERNQSPESRINLAQQIRRLSPDEAGVDSADGDVIGLSLHHTHLPKLDENDLIGYDPGSGKVTYASHPVLKDVFSIIYERESPTVEKLDGFLGGLGDACRRARPETGTEVEWPHFWRLPHHG